MNAPATPRPDCFACLRPASATVSVRGADLCAKCSDYVLGIVERIDVSPYSPAELLARIERQLPTQEPALPLADAAQPAAAPLAASTAATPGQPTAGDAAGADGGAGTLLDRHRACACRRCVPAVSNAPELGASERGLPTPPAPASASETPAEPRWYSEACDAAYAVVRAVDSFRLGVLSEGELGLELLRCWNVIGAAANRARHAGGGR